MTVKEDIKTATNDRELRYQIRMARLEGEEGIIVVEFQRISGDILDLYDAVKRIRAETDIENA